MRGALLLVLVVCAACREAAVDPTRPGAVRTITLHPIAAVLDEGDTLRFRAIPRDSTERIVPRTRGSWKSDRPEVVSIDSQGLVRALSAGYALITVQVDSITTSARVVVQPALQTTFSTLDVGSEHSCAITAEGRVLCWGSNTFGQLGDGTASERRTPVQAGGILARAIAAGGRHSCALARGSGVWCWGSNSALQLSDTAAGLKINPTPKLFFEEHSFASITAGSAHSCALDAGGQLHCWGSNQEQQLNAPPDSYRAVAAGNNHTCGITSANRLRCWGWNAHGQLGLALEDMRFRTVTAGYAFTCALALDGSTWCWGSNADGQLGDGTRNDSKIPVRALAPALEQTDAGARHVCGLSANGAVYCWGNNLNGILGVPSAAFAAQPIQVPVPPLRLVRAGVSHTCGVTLAQRFICWGDGKLGAMGS